MIKRPSQLASAFATGTHMMSTNHYPKGYGLRRRDGGVEMLLRIIVGVAFSIGFLLIVIGRVLRVFSVFLFALSAFVKRL